MNTRNRKRNSKNRQRNRKPFNANPERKPETLAAAGGDTNPSQPPTPNAAQQPARSEQGTASGNTKNISRSGDTAPHHHKAPFRRHSGGNGPNTGKNASLQGRSMQPKRKIEASKSQSEHRGAHAKNDHHDSHKANIPFIEKRINTLDFNLMELPTETNKSPELQENRPLKKYGVVFYDSFHQAKSDEINLQEKAKAFDRLNIVIKEEGHAEEPELLRFGRVYSGAAWHLIHERRVQDNWYNKPQE